MILLPALAGCMREVFRDDSIPGDGMLHFSAASAPDRIATKTAYSGEYVTENGDRYERIDWITSGTLQDYLHIISPQTATLGGLNESDYRVQALSHTNAGGYRESEAAMEPVSDGFQWVKSAQDHYFLSVYPSALRSGAVSSDCSFGMDPSNPASRGAVTAVIPQLQTCLSKQEQIINGKLQVEYLPDMNYAYMYAAAKIPGQQMDAKTIRLEYKPLFTAVKFVIRASDNSVNSYKVQSLTLSSKDGASGTDLCGTFSGTFGTGTDDRTGDFVLGGITGGQRSVSIHIPAEDQVTLEGKTLVVTFLLLPQDLTGLTLDITFRDAAGIIHKKIDLVNDKARTDWVNVEACNKLIANIGVMNYFFEVKQNITDKFPWDGSAAYSDYYTVTSYRRYGDEEPVAWPWDAVEYYWNGQWHPMPGTTAFEWVETYTGTNGASSSGEETLNTNLANTYPVRAGLNSPLDPNWNLSRPSSAANALNLACCDIHLNPTGGTDASPMETANCYVVDGPGWYKFPAVYGNAIKGGSVNEGAYKAPAGAADNVMKVFRNAKGADITSAWIPDDGFTITGAGVIWQDVQNMVDQVVYDASSKYVKFHVNSDVSALSPGNALIGIYDADGVCWSWHIWLVNEPAAYLSTLPVWYYVDAATTRSTLSYNDMLTKNIGYTDGNRSIPERSLRIKFRQRTSGLEGVLNVIQEGRWIDSGACYYQWGRKDPMFPALGAEPKEIYLSDGTAWYDQGMPTLSSSGSIQAAIRNPDKFFLMPDASTPWWGWYSASFENANLWDMSILQAPATSYFGEEYHCNQENSVKTVYDPSPAGFRVPNEYAFSGFNWMALDAVCFEELGENHLYTSAVIDPVTFNVAADKGINFYLNPLDHDAGTIYFPFLGRRTSYAISGGANAGEMDAQYRFGIYWTSAPYPAAKNGLWHYAHTFYLNTRNCYPSYGFHNMVNVNPDGSMKGNGNENGFRVGHGLQVRPVADRDAPPGISASEFIIGGLNLNEFGGAPNIRIYY